MASKKFQFRSISLPTRSHPTTSKLESQLTKLKNIYIYSTSTSFCNGLLALEDIYSCVHELVNVASTQQVLSLNRNDKTFDELLEESIQLIDVCSISIDMIVQVKESVQSLQSIVRRRKGESCIETNVADFVCFRKSLKKSGKKLVSTLKQMENKVGSLVDQDHHLAAVILVLREVNALTSSVFQSVLMYLSTPVVKPRQFSIQGILKLASPAAKVTTLGTAGSHSVTNDLERVDAALCNFSGLDRIQTAQKTLEELEIGIKDIENCLEGVFRLLIRTRVTFLNILSQ